jgi:hypothetical protein
MQNLDQLPATTIRYGIFAGQPPVGTPSTAVRGFLGKAARVASSSHNHVAPLSVTLNVTGKLSALVTDNQGVLELTVAPLDAAGKTTGRGIPLVADSITLIG